MDETRAVDRAHPQEPPFPGALESSGPPPDLYPEEIGDFRLQEHLGQGGMGVVFLAVQKSLNRQVALKLIKPGQASCPNARHVLFREARAASRLDHPGICTIYEIGEADGTPFLAMRYLEGQTLAEHIRAARTAAPGPAVPDRKEALALILLLEEAARALHAAHQVGLVHRDIKPSNLMITAGFKPVIMDFGLAREEKIEPGNATLAQGPLGTPTYMPPEQLEESAPPPDRRTDIYAIGVTLYEALTLQPPFEAPTWTQLYQKIRTGDYPDPLQLNPRLPRDIKLVLAAAMEQDPARRYQSAQDLAEDLRRVRLCQPIAVRPTGPLVRLGRWGQRNPVLASSLLGLFLFLATGLVLSLTMLDMVQRSLVRTRALGLASRSDQLLESDPIQALLLAREGARLSPQPTVLAQLLSTLQEARERAVITTRVHWVPSTVQFSPAGDLIAAATTATAKKETESRVRLHDLDGNELLSIPARKPGEPRGSAQFISLAFSPDGLRLLALVRFDIRRDAPANRLRVATWDRKGTRLMESLVHSQQASHAAFTPDGNGIALFDTSGAVVLTDLEGQETGRFQTLCGRSTKWRYHATSGLVLAANQLPGSNLLEAGLWDLSGKCLFHVSDLEGMALDLLFSRDGGRIGLLLPRRALILDREGNRLNDIPVHGIHPYTAMTFSPDGGQLALGFFGQVALHTVGQAERTRWPAHSDKIMDLCFSPDGEYLLSASKDRRATLWSLEGNKIFTLHGHEREVNHALFSPDGTKILTRSIDQALRVWDVIIPDTPYAYSCKGTWVPVDFRYDGSEILFLAHGGSVAALDFSGKLRCLVRLDESPALCLWASPVDGKFLTGHRHQGRYQVRLWDADGNPLSTLEGHEGFINYSAFLDTGNRILTSSADGTIRIWSLEGNELLRLGAKPQTTQAVSQLCCLSSRGDMILAASQELCTDQVVTLWDRNGEVVAFFSHEKKVRALGISPDDRHVVIGDDEGGVSLWKVEGPLVHRFEGDGKAITSVCFSPSGRHFLATSKDQSARLWEAHSGKLLMRFEETDSDLRHAEFSPDGRSFLTASPRTVRIWDLQTLRELLEIRCWDNGLRILSNRFARFCPDGKRVLTIHSDGMVKVWPATPEATLALADRRAHRSLTQAERMRHAELLRER